MIAGVLALFATACGSAPHTTYSLEAEAANQLADSSHPPVRPGIYRFFAESEAYRGRSMAVVANHTSLIEGVHLVDTLLQAGFEVKRIFAPEHGFRGDVADGATVKDQMDEATGLPIVSLYGNKKKPAPQLLADVDLMVFDIQDVGARFYTYLSTLHYIMQACAEAGVPLVVLDRPNPNVHFVDGPVLDMAFSSFVGMHPVPVVYGMTIGEYAEMINGEGWLGEGLKCDLAVVECLHYARDRNYTLPVPPSPNLPDMTAVYLYPSLCFFEGTYVSVGRGTSRPFTLMGAPGNLAGDTSFTPRPIAGVSDYPPQEGKLCRGYNLAPLIDVSSPPDSLQIRWLVQMYRESPSPDTFFLKSGFIDKLAGTDALRKQVKAGRSPDEIRKSWQPGLEAFAKVRAKYLRYPAELLPKGN